MDGESSVKTAPAARRWTDLGVVILSLLLAACVATIIFMAVKPQTPSGSGHQATPTSNQIDVKVEVNGQTTTEKVSYNEGRNTVFHYEEDGSFVAEDYDKGVVVTRPAGMNACLVIPTGTTISRDQVKSVLSAYSNGSVVHSGSTRTLQAQMLSGDIVDKDMFSDEMNEACKSYRWLIAVDQEGAGSFDAPATRQKRQSSQSTLSCSWHACRGLFSITYGDSIFGRSTTRFYLCVNYCFDSDCDYWSACQAAARE
jgi:hypothetical protein